MVVDVDAEQVARNARSTDGVIPPPPPANEQVLSFIDLLRLTKLWSNARL
jgi:hypothetical protein